VCVCVCVIGGFRAWVSVRGQNTQFVQYKNQYVYESPPHKDSKPDVCVCVCVCWAPSAAENLHLSAELVIKPDSSVCVCVCV